MRVMKQIAPLLIATAILLILFGNWAPNFFTVDNLLNLFQQVSVNAIIAFGMTLTILIGGIDLSVGAVLALVGTSTVYILTLTSQTMPTAAGLFLAILAGLSVAAFFGLFNGVCAAKTRMPAFIITLATMQIARGGAYCFNQARPIPVPDEQTWFLFLGNGYLWGKIPIPVLIMFALFVIMTFLLHATRFGQYCYAIGGSREAARFTGIPLVRTEMFVYIICGVLTGIAGMIHTSQLYSAEPGSGMAFELNAIAAAVVGGASFTGGIGTMYGTLLGAVIIGILDKGL
ncbi:MAG: ABC transporter permease, partial [Candidatus Omnitrophica bacterium]|nr:ABC transporter permease [Candidatus Omnitrophota bacterium]